MTSRSARKHTAAVVAAGLTLCAILASIAALSSRFEYGGDARDRPHVLLVALLMSAGIAYLAAIFSLQKLPPGRTLLIWVIAAGAIARGVLMFSIPIQEDDFYRYLWDGGVVSHGLNPYALAPDRILDETDRAEIPDDLVQLAADSGNVIHQINHPGLTSLYPPVAQAAFAAAHLLRPWSLGAWRATLFAFDIAALLLVMALLLKLGKPVHLAAIYWWNPILIKEGVNSAHMDIVVLPFALLALAFAMRNAPLRAATLAALAIGAKFWPLTLVPLLVRGLKTSKPRMAAALLSGAALAIVLTLPLIVSGENTENSGLAAYSERWEMNDALFMVVAKAADATLGLLKVEALSPLIAARVVVIIALISWIARWIRTRPTSPQDLCDRAVLILGAAFMLSPTQFPWYYLWLVPFLALSPRPSMLILTATLPIYYLKFHYDARGNIDFFHNVVVWFEYAPVFALAAWEAFTRWHPPIHAEAIEDA